MERGWQNLAQQTQPACEKAAEKEAEKEAGEVADEVAADGLKAEETPLRRGEEGSHPFTCEVVD